MEAVFVFLGIPRSLDAIKQVRLWVCFLADRTPNRQTLAINPNDRRARKALGLDRLR
jgi:hypothetical protein